MIRCAAYLENPHNFANSFPLIKNQPPLLLMTFCMSYPFLKCLDPSSQPTDWEPWHTNQLRISCWQVYKIPVSTQVPARFLLQMGTRWRFWGAQSFRIRHRIFFCLISDQRMSTTIAWIWGKFGSATRLEEGLYYIWHIPCQHSKYFLLAFHLSRSLSLRIILNMHSIHVCPSDREHHLIAIPLNLISEKDRETLPMREGNTRESLQNRWGLQTSCNLSNEQSPEKKFWALFNFFPPTQNSKEISSSLIPWLYITCTPVPIGQPRKAHDEFT